MEKIVGFADSYYTLWNVVVDENYITDAYGNYYLSSREHKFFYVKNISKSLDKVKEKYPTLSIDDSLRGKKRSFSSQEKIDKPDGYFWFGKYYGHSIDDILEKDFQYCLWALDNTNIRGLKDHPKILAHFKVQKDVETKKILDARPIKVGKATLTFKSNGFNAWWSNNGKITWQDSEYWDAEVNGCDRCHISAVSDDSDVEITVVSQGLKEVYGRFPYIMPMVNGKCRRTKNKTFEVEVYKVDEPRIDGDGVSQVIYIK